MQLDSFELLHVKALVEIGVHMVMFISVFRRLAGQGAGWKGDVFTKTQRGSRVNEIMRILRFG